MAKIWLFEPYSIKIETQWNTIPISYTDFDKHMIELSDDVLCNKINHVFMIQIF